MRQAAWTCRDPRRDRARGLRASAAHPLQRHLRRELECSRPFGKWFDRPFESAQDRLTTHNSERDGCRILTRKVWPSGWLDHVVAPDCHQLDTPLILYYTPYQDNAIDARGEKTQ